MLSVVHGNSKVPGCTKLMRACFYCKSLVEVANPS
jgi:hypothetical protein